MKDQKEITKKEKAPKTPIKAGKAAVAKATKKTVTKAPEHFSLFSEFDIGLFKAGKHYQLYNKLGAREVKHAGKKGVYFAVWAPNAKYVSVVGNFNAWNRGANPMNVRWDESGIWEMFIPGIGEGELYKYFVESHNGYKAEKADPYAFCSETPPKTASVVCNLNHKWGDKKWMSQRQSASPLSGPISVYEVHPGSWRRKNGDELLSYLELAEQLPAYCRDMGFTHVEFMPVMEHPFYGSWGYQITGYFSVTSRYGSPQDFMQLVNELHKAGVGVILDWVPSHFPSDEHGLGYFDGSHLYEHEDPRKGFHPDWQSLIFNYGRNEVRAFLISNALFWLDMYHIDALRVDAVASLLYLDYSRKEGEWLPNQYGGRENLEAISLIQEFNQAVHTYQPGTFTVAEESTAYTGVTHSVDDGGLGFDMKWMMGWMHDTLSYFQKDPIHRGFHHNMLSFSIYYAFSERFLLPLSHDEVVHGKGSLLGKMPGQGMQEFANLRLLYAYMYGHPGAKLIFMGNEFGQRSEWRHDHSLDWHENDYPSHNGVQKVLKDLNALYKSEPAMHRHNFSAEGFEWIDFNDHSNSVLSWVRKGNPEDPVLVFVANFTPVARENYRIGVPKKGDYKEIFNSDDARYEGTNVHNKEVLHSQDISCHGRGQSVSMVLPPLGMVVLKGKS